MPLETVSSQADSAGLIPVTRSTGESVYRVVSLRPDSAPPGGGGYGRHGVIGPWPGDDHNDVPDAEGSNLRTPARERIGGLPRCNRVLRVFSMSS